MRVATRAFDDHAGQANFGLGQVKTSWVLSLDADYVLTSGFQNALRAGAFPWEVDCVYFAPFRWCVEGHPLRGNLYPPRGVLYAHEGARYDQDGHAHKISLAGRRKVMLPYEIYHDDRKSSARWLQSQEKYARMEAEKLTAAAPEGLRIQDKLRRTGWAAPIVVVPYALFVRGLIFDGWPGMLYALQRGYAELLLALFILEKRLRRK